MFMGFGDFSPSSHSYKKPISKAQLKKMKENFEKAEDIVNSLKQKEEEEKEIAKNEFNSSLNYL